MAWEENDSRTDRSDEHLKLNYLTNQEIPSAGESAVDIIVRVPVLKIWFCLLVELNGKCLKDFVKMLPASMYEMGGNTQIKVVREYLEGLVYLPYELLRKTL